MEIVLKGLKGSTAEDSNSTDSAPTENSSITTNSSEKLFQNEQNGTRVDTDFTQEKRDNMTAYPIKPSEPSEPSAMDVGCSTNNEICNGKPTATTRISTLTSDASEEQGGFTFRFQMLLLQSGLFI